MLLDCCALKMQSLDAAILKAGPFSVCKAGFLGEAGGGCLSHLRISLADDPL